MRTQQYKQSAGVVYNLHFHLVWCPKYRKKVLIDAVGTRLKELLYEKAAALDIEIEAMEVMPDHVHVFVAPHPLHAPQFLANQFKGYTSRVLRQEFPHLRSQLPTLWSRSYFIGSAGTVTAATIRHYIEHQKTRS
ncbi:MAG: IS200/IS605 family transposase [Herpetosiphonaceae bacterium]|nr:IS200/IS605 family transposase [Herpetosiphonaceae bacterium]